MSKRIRHPKPKQPATVVQSTKASLPITLAIGDCIAVKPGVKDPDLGVDIGGWQGRVTEIDPGGADILITFQWDSLALQHLPASFIRYCEENGLDWASMTLDQHDIEPAEPRDRQEDVDKIIGQLSAEHAWDHLGEQGGLIATVLQNIDQDDDVAAFEAWQKYLEARLKLPFEAVISEHQDYGPFKVGDRLTVVGFAGVDDPYGVLVDVTKGRSPYVFPLCDLEATNKKTNNYILADAYAVWFANR